MSVIGPLRKDDLFEELFSPEKAGPEEGKLNAEIHSGAKLK